MNNRSGATTAARELTETRRAEAVKTISSPRKILPTKALPRPARTRCWTYYLQDLTVLVVKPSASAVQAPFVRCNVNCSVQIHFDSNLEVYILAKSCLFKDNQCGCSRMLLPYSTQHRANLANALASKKAIMRGLIRLQSYMLLSACHVLTAQVSGLMYAQRFMVGSVVYAHIAA